MTTPDRQNEAPRAALEAVDAALAGGALTAEDPELRELQALSLLIRDESPVADPRFAAELERRVVEGFPRARRFPAWAPLPARPAGSGRRLRGRLRSTVGRRAIPVVGSAAAALLALAFAVSLRPGGDEAQQAGGGRGTLEPSDASEAPGAEGAPAPLGDQALPRTAPAPPIAPGPGGGRIAPGERDRRIERSASLTLAAPPDRLDAVADSVTAIADRRRGFVLRSLLSTGDGGATGGSFELRIPVRELQPALRDLSAVATVRSRSQSGEDVTPAFVSLEDRLAAARAERRGLLRRLERAESDRAAQAIRERIELVSGEINSLRDQLAELRERTDYAAVFVSLVEDEGDDGAAGGGTREALDDALGSLEGALNLTLRLLGVAIPLALAAGMAWLAAAAIRRRRREAALS